jgi:hypothetical protein
VTDLLRTQGVDPGDRSLPRSVARATAFVLERAWRMFRLAGAPPITRTAIRLAGEAVTVSDARARRDLGYRGEVTREAGLAELRASTNPAAARE